jgi:hypothetical protein
LPKLLSDLSSAWASFALVCLLTSTARAQRAEYVKPDDLPDDGVSHLAELGMFGQYTRVDDQIDAAAFAAKSRFYLGRVPAYCLGQEGAIGGGSAGLLYDVTLYPLGLGMRFGSASVVSLCGGARIDAIGSDVPWAISFPAELRAALSLGPLFPVFQLRPSWVIRREERQDGVGLSFIDELEATLFVRIGRQHRYWSDVTAGGGFSFGVGYRGLMDRHAISVLLGFHFAGER